MLFARIMSESVLSDDDVIIDHDPQEHPPVLSNKNPYFLSSVVSSSECCLSGYIISLFNKINI